jgi:hypothetical protein
LRGVDQSGQGHGWWIVHEEVDVVGFAVAFAEFGIEVLAHRGHDFLAAGEDRVGEGAASILRGEDQMCVEVVNDAPATSHIGVWGPSR